MANKLLQYITIILVTVSVTFANADTIYTDSTTRSTVDSTLNSNTKITSPPPSAISPNINTTNSDLCTVGVAGAVQTQILGISAGTTVRDMNCEMLKNSKTLYDMGMKVAAVSLLCSDKRVFDSMQNAGSPCPFMGKVGPEAQRLWDDNPHLVPGYVAGKKKAWTDAEKSTAKGAAGVGGLFALLLFLI